MVTNLPLRIWFISLTLNPISQFPVVAYEQSSYDAFSLQLRYIRLTHPQDIPKDFVGVLS